MDSLKVFVLAITEVSNYMILWNLLNRSDEKRLVKSVKIIVLTSIIVLLTSFIFPYIQFITNYLFIFLLIKIYYKIDVRHLVFGFSIITSIFIIIQLAIIGFIRLTCVSFMRSNIFLNSLIVNIICIIVSICISKFVNIKKFQVICKQESAKIYFFTLNLIIYMVIVKFIWNFKRQILLGDIILFLLVPAIIIAVNMLFLIYHIKKNELEKSLEEYQKYSPVISDLLEDVRRRQHDFKNHLNTIYGLIQVSDEKTLKETVRQYLNSLNISLNKIDDVLQINNTVVTAIIYNKINEAAKSNIDFKCRIQNHCIELPFKDHELSEVLNNLLDNAFEAVYNSDKEIKKVFLNIGYLEDNCIIEIGNTGDRIEFNNISKIFDLGFSTKGEEGHGYGLYNVKKIVESYGSKIQLSFEDGFTIFRIISEAQSM